MDGLLKNLQENKDSLERTLQLEYFITNNSSNFKFCVTEKDLKVKKDLINALIWHLFHANKESLPKDTDKSLIFSILKILLRERQGCDALFQLEFANPLFMMLYEPTSTESLWLTELLAFLCNFLHYQEKEILKKFADSKTVSLLKGDACLGHTERAFFAARCIFLILVENSTLLSLQESSPLLLEYVKNDKLSIDFRLESLKIVTLLVATQGTSLLTLSQIESLERDLFGLIRTEPSDARIFNQVVQCLCSLPVPAERSHCYDVASLDQYDILLKKTLGLVSSTNNEISAESVSVHFVYLKFLLKGNNGVSLRKHYRQYILPNKRQIISREVPSDTVLLESKQSTNSLDILINVITGGTTCIVLKESIEDFLFELVNRKVERYIYHLGYGVAAGLLFRLNLLNDTHSKDTLRDRTSDMSSDEDDLARSEFDPVTLRRFENEEKITPMTEEEKEIEAEKLMDLFGKLEQTGLFKIQKP